MDAIIWLLQMKLYITFADSFKSFHRNGDRRERKHSRMLRYNDTNIEMISLRCQGANKSKRHFISARLAFYGSIRLRYLCISIRCGIASHNEC